MAGVSTLSDTRNRLGGVAEIAINGTPYFLVGDLNWSVGRKQRSTLRGLDGVHGYAEQWEPSHISCKLRDNGTLRVGDLNDLTNCDIVVRQANGKNVSGFGMWNMVAQEVQAIDGTFDVRFEGFPDAVREN